MFKIATKDEMGTYIKRAIKKKGFPSHRQFGKSCLEEWGMPTDDEELRKISNRLSQIINGKKWIQIEDLPVFSKLLDMSCEEILSAGKCFSASSSHVTNYSIAMSRDVDEWEAYIKREDRLILNADEYGKTVIDYALEFENYDFLRYLTEHKYIWFVGTDENDLFHNDFGAGTSIERNPMLIKNINLLDAKMKERYDLRIKMITLAIKHGDMKMLTELRTREIPTLYQACWYSVIPTESEKYFDSEMMEALSNASDEVLEFFSKEFKITNRFGTTDIFVFPFISRLIETLIKTNNSYVQWMLKDAIKHNQYAFDKLKELLDLSAEYFKDLHSYNNKWEIIKDNIRNGILQDIRRYDDGKMICYRTVNGKDGIITNLVKVDATSDNVQIKRLIQEVNESYEAVQNITLSI